MVKKQLIEGKYTRVVQHMYIKGVVNNGWRMCVYMYTIVQHN